ncbi:hypothetical protein D3C76_27770 [compost metagenome]
MLLRILLLGFGLLVAAWAIQAAIVAAAPAIAVVIVVAVVLTVLWWTDYPNDGNSKPPE